MLTPSTNWKEIVQPDEAARHAAAAEAFTALQRAKSSQFGNGRTLHRKSLIALRASLIVPPGLPAFARHGVFAEPGAHAVWVRLSNGGTDVQSDRRPDVRGFSLRVWDVKGPAALGGQTDHQDFALINHRAFAFPDSEPFVDLVVARGKGLPAVLAWAVKTYGVLGVLPALARLRKIFSVPFTGFATESFFSAAPLSCGPHAVRVRLLPPSDQRPLATAPQDWSADLLSRLGNAPLHYRLQLQFFVDETRTPIEDASVDWPESVAAYVNVATLRLTAPGGGQPDAAFEAQVDQSVFDPWQALMAHRPLGEVMRARKVVYFASQKERGAA